MRDRLDAPPIDRVVNALDRVQWRAFVDEQPSASVFHTPEMHAAFAQARNHEPSVWATLDEAGEIRALMTPVAMTTLGGPLRSLTTRIVAFGGPLVAPGPEAVRGEMLAALLRAFQRRTGRTALFTELRHSHDASDLVPSLAACGFRHEPHLNFLVDLDLSDGELWHNVRSSARRNIQKARRLGVTITEADDEADRAAGYAVLRDVYSRIRVPLPDRSLFEAAHSVLRPLDRYVMLLAKVEGRTIGVLTLLLHMDVVLYWYTGTRRADSEYRAADLLVWHAIELGRARGCRVLDFKAKYGGRLVDFGRDTWVPAPVRLRVATLGYEKVRRFL
jgi:CelD/BcsL family acetyltransferase involved in cellulose biosynthesis